MTTADEVGAAPGPYETETQAHADCRDVYDQAHTQPQGAMWRSNEERLLAACKAAGVELGAYDARILSWLAVWEPTTVQVLIGVIDRARAGAELAVAEEIATALESPPAMSNREMTDCRDADDDAERAAAVGDVYLRYAAGVARRIGGA